MTKVYLIRHGFTPANNASLNNQEGLWKIASDVNMPLEKEYGIKQALEIGTFLSDLNGKILILVSPYYRTKQTLSLALSKMKGNYEIKETFELKEFNSGVHYAHTIEEVLRMYPESKKYFEIATVNLEQATYTGGESREQVKDRVKDISLKIQNLVDLNKYDYILVFGHGMTNKYIYYWLTGKLMDHDMKNGEIISVYDQRTIFVPKTFVPKGFMVNISDYLVK